jgi:hypothetical protein
MNELLAQLFGSQPSYAGQLLGEDEARRLQQQAQQSGLLNVGLALLAGAGPSPQRRGVGELLAQGVMAGQQAYQGAYNKALQEQALKEQIAERQQMRKEQQMAQQLLPQILRPGAQTPTFYGQPTQMPLRDDEGNIMPGAGMTVGQPQIDMNTLQQLLTRAPSVAGKVLPTVEAFRKLTAPEEFDLAEGAQRFRRDPVTGQVTPIAGAPKPREPKFTTVDVGNAIIEYMDGVEVGRKPKGRAPEGPVSLQTVETEAGLMTFNPRTGQLTPVMQDGKPVAGKGAKPTEGERNAAGYAGRMIAANQIISQPAIASAAPGLGSGLAASVPFVGESLRNLAQSPETQQYAQAARDWIRAKLRKESGAAIGVAEEENEFRTYFPVTGDSPRVIEQKAQARALANQGMIQAAGSAKIPEPTQPPIDLRTAAQRELERRLRGQ